MCGTTEVTFQNHYCKYCACFEKRHPFLLLQLLLHRLLLITSTWRSNSTYSDLVKQPVDRNITWILGSTSSCIQLVVCWLPVFAISSADYHTSPCSMESCTRILESSHGFPFWRDRQVPQPIWCRRRWPGKPGVAGEGCLHSGSF